MPLNLFYTIVQKSQKWPKTQIKGGSCLNVAVNSPKHWLGMGWKHNSCFGKKARFECLLYQTQKRLVFCACALAE